MISERSSCSYYLISKGYRSTSTLRINSNPVCPRIVVYGYNLSITTPDVSVNKRIDMDKYPEMIYGWCLTRLIHFVVALRLKFPTKRLLTAKYNLSDAYRRVAHSAY